MWILSGKFKILRIVSSCSKTRSDKISAYSRYGLYLLWYRDEEKSITIINNYKVVPLPIEIEYNIHIIFIFRCNAAISKRFKVYFHTVSWLKACNVQWLFSVTSCFPNSLINMCNNIFTTLCWKILTYRFCIFSSYYNVIYSVPVRMQIKKRVEF